MNVVIILPTFNELENIQKLIPVLEEDIFPNIKDHKLSILVADDNSPDGTAEAVEKLSIKYKNIKISKGPKKGLGAAYLRGMSYAVEQMGADVVFEMDADGQHDPTKISEFLKKIDDGCDMVVGTRYSGGGSIPKNWPPQRKLFSITANLLVRTIFMRFSIHDWTGGYRALKKEVFLKEKDHLKNFNGYIFQIAFLHQAVADGFRIGEVPFHFSDRTLGKSKIAPLGYIFDVLYFVVTARIKELVTGSFGKFLVVGGIGFVINAVLLRVLVQYFNWNPSFANLGGAAAAIFSNYNFNNIWTFRKHKINGVGTYFMKMLQFYATSAFGVIFIQTGTIFLGDTFITRKYYFTYFLIGTGLLLIWNYTIYNKFIWKKKV